MKAAVPAFAQAPTGTGTAGAAPLARSLNTYVTIAGAGG